MALDGRRCEVDRAPVDKTTDARPAYDPVPRSGVRLSVSSCAQRRCSRFARYPSSTCDLVRSSVSKAFSTRPSRSWQAINARRCLAFVFQKSGAQRDRQAALNAIDRRLGRPIAAHGLPDLVSGLRNCRQQMGSVSEVWEHCHVERYARRARLLRLLLRVCQSQQTLALQHIGHRVVDLLAAGSKQSAAATASP